MSSRMKLGYPENEPLPANIYADFEWSGKNRQSLNQQYGDVVIVVYQKQVIGVGETREKALQDAEMNLPESPEIITPVVRYIGSKLRLHRVNRQTSQE